MRQYKVSQFYCLYRLLYWTHLKKKKKKKIQDLTYSVIKNECLSFLFMSRNYKSVCEELDALTVSYLSILEEYREQWKESSSELQEVRKEKERKGGY
jgi:hypothetical protein